MDGRQWLRLDSHVGMLESPCGQVIEILPKHHDDGDCEVSARRLLRKLIASALDLPSRDVQRTGLQLFNSSLSEWVMRQPSGRQYCFQIRHDVFLPDRPENRLLQSALTLVYQTAQDADNWRLAHELAGMLHELPASCDINADFLAWRNDQLMAHYQPLKPWCELILYRHMPQAVAVAVAGDYRGISLLFPMERRFEHHVARWLRHHLLRGASLTTQASRYALCTHAGQAIFQLKTMPESSVKLSNMNAAVR